MALGEDQKWLGKDLIHWLVRTSRASKIARHLITIKKKWNPVFPEEPWQLLPKVGAGELFKKKIKK